MPAVGLECTPEKHEKYRTVLAVLDEGVVLHRADGSIAECNPGACRILGLSEDEILGRTSRDPRWKAVHEDGTPFDADDHPGWVTCSTGRPCREVVMGVDRPDGRRRWISINSVALSRPGEPPPFSAVVSFSDITHFKEAEERLRHHVAELRTTRDALRLVESAVENARESIVILSPGSEPADPTILYVNPAFAALTGYSLAEVVGQSPRLLEGPKSDRNLFHAMQRILAAGKPSHGRTIHYTKDGRELILDWTFAAFRDGLGNLTHGHAILRDVTDLVRLRESLMESERLSAVGTLLASVSHEVRNPLFGITTALTAFEEDLERDPRFERYFELLHGEVRRLSDLMQDLLDYGKPSRFDAAPGDLAEVLQTAAGLCDALCRRRGVEIRLDADELPLLMDHRRLVQVYRNLLENALQHAPAGSTVTVRARRVQEPGGDRILSSVEDRGPGFREDDLPHLFEPFFTRRDQGTGLGLAIVRAIVEQHGGTVSAANRPGGGALFSVSLPAVSPAAADARQQELFAPWRPLPADPEAGA